MMHWKSLSELTLDSHLALVATLRGTHEPGDTSEEIAIRDLADLTAHGALITRVHTSDAAGRVRFEYLITVERLVRYEAAWGDPTEPVAVAVWRQGFREGQATDLDGICRRLHLLWWERYVSPLWEESAEEDTKPLSMSH